MTDSSGSCTWCNSSCINTSVLINGSKDMDMMNQALNNAKQCETIIYCINIYIIYIIFLKKAFVFLVSHIEMCVSGESLH